MLVKDYVCGMQVEDGKNRIVHAGGNYSFCSRQCQERFLDNPHLYIGIPGGQKAPKQEGVTVIKRRRLRLAQPLSPEQARVLIEALHTMMGVRSVSVEGDSVAITYDLLEAMEEQIEEKLEEIGIRLGDGLAERLRRAFVHYEEECEADNLEARKDMYPYQHPE